MIMKGSISAMSYIGGGPYYAEICPLCGSILWNGRCENQDCYFHWHPREDDDDKTEHPNG